MIFAIRFLLTNSFRLAKILRNMLIAELQFGFQRTQTVSYTRFLSLVLTDIYNTRSSEQCQEYSSL